MHAGFQTLMLCSEILIEHSPDEVIQDRIRVQYFKSPDVRTVNARASCVGGREFESQAGQTHTALQTVSHRFIIYASSCFASAIICRRDKHRKLITRIGVIRRV